MNDVSKNLGSEIRRFSSPDFQPVTGKRYPTGFQKLDEELHGGFSIGTHCISGRPSEGKTTLALQIAENISKTGYPVLIFSTETLAETMGAASISRASYKLNPETALCSSEVIAAVNKQSGDISPELIAAISRASSDNSNIEVYDCSSWSHTVEEIEGKARNLKKEHEDFLIIVDYAQEFLSADGKFEEDRKALIDHVITSLKFLSQVLQIPILIISAINRDNYVGQVEMGSLKDSGRLEYNFDTILAIERALGGDEKIRKINLAILKQRTGVADIRIPFDYHAKYNFFTERKVSEKVDPQGKQGNLFFNGLMDDLY